MKKFYIALLGGTVVLIGVAMLVLPGPGTLVIAGGLAILATEFIWARRALRKAKGAVAKVRRKSGGLSFFMRRRRQSPPPIQ
ncbi:MAG: PGPGW domain-containing protein [Verrucomicrobiota bacterium]|nr:PGPGW domain-containing protein [Verrucomicrobiota bacterium]MCC6819778.1 PGPGW domain-containing protein [Limisphaerales bacterium]